MNELAGEIDTTYHTVQRDLFESGTVARVGAQAFAVWSAVKAHADFENGRAWPSIRTIAAAVGMGKTSVQRAVDVLVREHLLRVEAKGWPSNPGRGKRGRTHTYVARERLDVRLGGRVLCTVVLDYVPVALAQRLRDIKQALVSPHESSRDLWADVDIIPGRGFAWDDDRKVLTARVGVDEAAAGLGVAATTIRSLPSQQRGQARERLRELAAQMRAKPGLPEL